MLHVADGKNYTRNMIVDMLDAEPVWGLHNYTLHIEGFHFGVQGLPPELAATPC
jgi:hypothetical protein